MEIKHLLLSGLAATACAFAATAQTPEPTNVLLGKSVIEVAGNPAAASEGPEKLIDGDLTTKYCIIKARPFVVIDALGYYTFSSFKFHDCKTNENEENASAYKLELSMDGKTWTVAAEASNVADVDLKEITLATPMKARYVKFSPTYNNCARMWELEGFGVESKTLAASLVSQETIELNIGESAEIKVKVDVTGERATDYSFTATASKGCVTVGTPAEAEGVYTFSVSGVAKGKADVTVKIVNDGEVVEINVPVKVLSDAPADVSACVEISNWSKDIISEQLENAADTYIDKKSYSGGSLTFYSADLKEEGAICDTEGLVETADGNVYQLSATSKNTIAADADWEEGVPQEINFANPRATDAVCLLCCAWANNNNAQNYNAYVKYEDGSSSEQITGTIKHCVADAVDGDEAVCGLGVVEESYYETVISTSFNKRLYEIEIPADATKKVASVFIANTTDTGRATIFVLGVNAEDANAGEVKHLAAELAATDIKVRQEGTAQLVVNYTLTDIEGLSDKLVYSAVAQKGNVTISEITDAEGKLKMDITGVNPGEDVVTVTLTFGKQTIRLRANVIIKKKAVEADTSDCIEIGNWNVDVIAESVPASAAVSGKVDEDGYVFYTDDIKAEGSLCGEEGIIPVKDKLVFKLAPFNENNAVVISANSEYTLEFKQPVNISALNLLVMSANGASDVDANVNYENNEASPVASHNVADWYNTDPDGSEAASGIGRIDTRNDSDRGGNPNFVLYSIPVQTDGSQNAVSATVKNKSNSYLTVIGAHGDKGGTSTSIDINLADGNKKPVAYYNLLGNKVSNPSEGVFIVRYSDGSVEKIIIK